MCAALHQSHLMMMPRESSDTPEEEMVTNRKKGGDGRAAGHNNGALNHTLPGFHNSFAAPSTVTVAADGAKSSK